MLSTVYQNYYKIITKILLILIICLSIYLLITYLIPFFLPFVIAFFLALINEPLIKLLTTITKLPRKVASAISLIITLTIIAIIATFGILKIYNELVFLQDNVGTYVDKLSSVYNDWKQSISAFYSSLPPSITNSLDGQIVGITPKIQLMVSGTVTYLINTLSSVPKMIIFIIVTILSTYFMSSGRIEIRTFFYKQIPQKWADNFRDIKMETFKSLIKYFKAILILISITFVEVLIGLWILGVDYVLLMALLLALADAIPLFGTGLVFIPWIIFSILTGNTKMIIGLAIIWAVGFAIRQILEPKIVGHNIGLHPLVTLMSIYVGLIVFGMIGVFVGPISLIVIKNLQNSGLFTLWTE